jgi:type II secretory pathway component PulK
MISIESTSNGITLDFDSSSSWTVVVKGEKLGLSLDDHRVELSLLPFLEMGKEKVQEQIQDESALNSFPELVLIEAGLKNGSEHWVGCAFDWLDSKENFEVQKFSSYYKEVQENKKKYSQATRHKAKALLKLAG